MFRSVYDILKELIHTMDSPALIKDGLAMLYWSTVVGERLSKVSEATYASQGILFVNTLSSAWAQELSYLKPMIMEKLNRQLGEDWVKDIRFRSGLNRRHKGYNKKKKSIELNSINIEEEEIKRIEDNIALIYDSELQTLLKNILTKEAKLRKWKESLGYKPCQICGCLIEKEDYCFLCLKKKKDAYRLKLAGIPAKKRAKKR